jgi:hypothetical protein
MSAKVETLLLNTLRKLQAVEGRRDAAVSAEDKEICVTLVENTESFLKSLRSLKESILGDENAAKSKELADLNLKVRGDAARVISLFLMTAVFAILLFAWQAAPIVCGQIFLSSFVSFLWPLVIIGLYHAAPKIMEFDDSNFVCNFRKSHHLSYAADLAYSLPNSCRYIQRSRRRCRDMVRGVSGDATEVVHGVLRKNLG